MSSLIARVTGQAGQSRAGQGGAGAKQGTAEQVNSPQQGPLPLSPGEMCHELAQWLRIRCGGGPAGSGTCLQTQSLQATGFPAPMAHVSGVTEKIGEMQCTITRSSEDTKGPQWEQPACLFWKWSVCNQLPVGLCSSMLLSDVCVYDVACMQSTSA